VFFGGQWGKFKSSLSELRSFLEGILNEREEILAQSPGELPSYVITTLKKCFGVLSDESSTATLQRFQYFGLASFDEKARH
jgi:hypothetical protein